MIKRLFLLFLLLSSLSGYASHLAGGEISYKCLGNGNFRFRVTIFRDCTGAPFPTTSLTLAGPVPILCNLIGAYDITPSLNCVGMACPTPALQTGQKGAMAKFVFEGTADLSNLGPTPPTAYTWSTTDIPCCRNQSANTNGTCTYLVLRIKMYPYYDANNLAFTPAQLCDNSPGFLEDPNIVALINPYDTIVFNGFGEDTDIGDVLRYQIDYPWTDSNQLCSYILGYTLAAPIPGIIGSNIDSLTGKFMFNPVLSGNFNLVFRVGSYRNGQLISEVFRDMQAIIINRPASAPIPFNPAIPPGTIQYKQQQQAPLISGNITHPVTGLPDRVIVLYPGDTMRVNYTVKDSFPILPVPNRIFSYVRSEVLGDSGISQLTGCAEPPCAIILNLSTTSPVVEVNLRNRQQGYGLIADTAGWDVNGQIFWTPQAVHAQLSGVATTRKYYFGVFAFDDICPLSASNAEFFEVNVLPNFTLLQAPATLCIQALVNNDVHLRWPGIIDSVSLEWGDSLIAGLSRAERLQRTINRRRASFVRSELYRINLADNSLNLRATFTHPDSTTYVDRQIPADSLFAYSLRVVSVLDSQGMVRSRPLTAIRLQLTVDRPNMTFVISWPAPYTAGSPLSFDGWYYLYSRNRSLQTPWTLIDSVQHLLQLSRPLQFGADTLEFRLAWKSGAVCDLSYSFPIQTTFPLFIPSEKTDFSYRLYPNPVKNLLHIRFEGLDEPHSWKIYDMTGRLMLDGEWRQAPLDVSFLPAANYTLVLDFGNNRSNRAIFNKAD